MLMKAAKIREHTDDELRQMAEDTAQQIYDLHTKKGAADATDHPLRVRLLRRELARIKTIIRERELKRNG
jgi:large subunit ribosomal protein L29